MLKKLYNIGFEHRFFLIVLCSAVTIKFFFAPFFPFKSDMSSWRGWGYQLYSNGIPQFYSQTTWTDYTPGYLYFLWLTTVVKQAFFQEVSLLGEEFLYKFFPIVLDLATGFLIYLIVDKYFSATKRKLALITSVIYFLLPHTTMNAAIWGQADSVHTFFLILAWYMLLTKRMHLLMVFFTFACVVKPLSGLIAPIIIVIMIKQGTFKFLTMGIAAATTFMVVTFPFWGINAPVSLITQLQSSYEVYPYSSLNTYNFWGAFGFWQKDDRLFIGEVTAEQFAQYGLFTSLIMAMLYTVLATSKFVDTKHTFMWYSLGASLCILGGITFASRMHERYLYHFFPFLLIFLSIYYGSKYKDALKMIYRPGFVIFVGLALLHFINLYYVYVLYLFFDTGVPAEQSLFYFIEGLNTSLSWSHIVLSGFLLIFCIHVFAKWPKIITSL